MKVSAVFKSKLRAISVKVPEFECAVDLTYDRGKLTVAYQKELGEKSASEFISEVVTKWNLEDDEGNMYPISDESISELPRDVVRRICDAILGDTSPNSEESPKDSDSTW